MGLTLMMSFLLIISCSDDMINETLEDTQASPQAVENLIQYAKGIYYTNNSKLRSLSNNTNNPSWESYEIFKQSNDTLSVSIPVGHDPQGRKQILIANEVNSQQQVYLVNLPTSDYDSLPKNERQRIVLNINDEEVICKVVTDRNGQLKLARLRNISNLRSNPAYGINLPEVVIFPSGFDYGVDWWWWDYISGLISFPPPENYGGFTGGYTENKDDSKTRPDYYKAQNVYKDTNVKNAVNKMMQNTKNDADKSKGRRERGFWVYYDTKTKKYYTGNEKTGTYVKGNIGTNGTVSPGSALPSSNGSHIPSTATPVTFVHTHTPLTYENNCQREVGFSQSDMDYADRHNIEIIVIDYVGTPDNNGKNFIYGGHNIEDPTKEYIYIPNK